MKNDKKQKLLASLSDFAKNFPVFLERLPFYILIAFYIFILACRTYISFASGEFMLKCQIFVKLIRKGKEENVGGFGKRRYCASGALPVCPL